MTKRKRLVIAAVLLLLGGWVVWQMTRDRGGLVPRVLMLACITPPTAARSALPRR